VVREVHQLVLRELRMQRDVHQAGEAGCLNWRQAGDVPGIKCSATDDS